MKLYKFASPKAADAIVSNRTVLMQCPLNFNDPFDVRETLLGSSLDYSTLDQELRDAILQAVTAPVFSPIFPNKMTPKLMEWRGNLHSGQCTKDHVSQWLEADDLANDLASSNTRRDRAWREDLNSIRVFCLSNVKPWIANESCTMWSHYTCSHQGVALEFEVEGWFADKLKEVRYYPEVPPITSNELYVQFMIGLLKTFFCGGFEEIFTAKANCWSYEKEWRVVSSANPPSHLIDGQYAAFEPTFLSSITFGCRATEDFIQRIKQATADRIGSHVDFYKLDVKPGSFEFHRTIV